MASEGPSEPTEEKGGICELNGVATPWLEREAAERVGKVGTDAVSSGNCDDREEDTAKKAEVAGELAVTNAEADGN